MLRVSDLNLIRTVGTYRNSKGGQFNILASVKGVVREVLADVIVHAQHGFAVIVLVRFYCNIRWESILLTTQDSYSPTYYSPHL